MILGWNFVLVNAYIAEQDTTSQNLCKQPPSFLNIHSSTIMNRMGSTTQTIGLQVDCTSKLSMPQVLGGSVTM